MLSIHNDKTRKTQLKEPHWTSPHIGLDAPCGKGDQVHGTENNRHVDSTRNCAEHKETETHQVEDGKEKDGLVAT